MVRDESLAAAEDVALAPCAVEHNQAVGRRDCYAFAIRARHDAVDAKQAVILEVADAAVIDDVEPAVEVSGPKSSRAIHGKRREIGVGESRRIGPDEAVPAAAGCARSV